MPAKDKPEEELREQLADACKNLWWSSESDYPIKIVWQPEVEINNNSAVEVIDQWVSDRHPEDAIEKVDLNVFFERATTPKSWHTDKDKAQLTRLKHLKAFLIVQLSDLQVYRCGEVEIKVYVLGCSTGNVLSGVQTMVVET